MSRFLPGQLVYYRTGKVKAKVLPCDVPQVCRIQLLPESGLEKIQPILVAADKWLLPIPDFTPAKYRFTTLMYLLKAGALPPL